MERYDKDGGRGERPVGAVRAEVTVGTGCPGTGPGGGGLSGALGPGRRPGGRLAQGLCCFLCG